MNASAQTFFCIFTVLFFAHEIWETGLTLLNNAHMRKHAGAVPDYFKDKIDPERYQKSIRYNLESARFGLINRWFGAALIWAMILSGGFEGLDVWITEHFSNVSGLVHSVLYCLAIGLILLVLKIPTSIYSQFVIEEKYGFNKMTAKTFIVDFLKGLGLGALIGIPPLYVVFWIYQKAGPLWWLWAFGVVFGFELLMAAVYPTLLAPLFNKFSPLPEGPLKEAIHNLAKKINFKMSGVFTIDGSRRSSHSNAYFAGMGKMRRIVLFDTLQSQLTEPEILAVLGHEMGHNKMRHIQKQLILSFFLSLIGFWALSLAMGWEPFYEAFRAGAPAPHKGLVLFALFSGHFTFFLPVFVNFLSRKYEYEADQFSIEVVGDRPSMASSLVALSRENLSNLTPHPWYSFYHYTHPTTLERVKAIG